MIPSLVVSFGAFDAANGWVVQSLEGDKLIARLIRGRNGNVERDVDAATLWGHFQPNTAL